MDFQSIFDSYIKELHILTNKKYVPDETEELYFPDPDFLDKIVWMAIILPLSGSLILDLYSRLQNCFSYEDAKARLTSDELDNLTSDTIASI